MSDPLWIREIFSSIQGEGYLAGRRQIFVRLTECNLDCSYCDTPHARSETGLLESAPGSNRFISLPQPLALERLLEIVRDWTSQLPGAHHSISFTGGEPLLSSDTLREWFPHLAGILPIHLETNGTMHLALEQVLDQVEFISMDMKLPSTAGCTEQLWDLHRLFLEVACRRQVSVKLVVADNSTDDEINRACDIIATIHRSTPLFLQPLTLPDGRVGIGAARLLELQARAAARLPEVRVIPQMHKLLGVA